MKIYVVYGFYTHEGCGSPTKAFSNETDAKRFVKEIKTYMSTKPIFNDDDCDFDGEEYDYDTYFRSLEEYHNNHPELEFANYDDVSYVELDVL